MKTLINLYFVPSNKYSNLENVIVAHILEGDDDYRDLYLIKKDNFYFEINEQRNEDIELIKFDVNDLEYLHNNKRIFKLHTNN